MIFFCSFPLLNCSRLIYDESQLENALINSSVKVYPAVIMSSHRLLHRWYHGPISRMVACQRLEAINTPGAYLIRESSSERGAFVLSFLDSTSRVHHFRIVRSHQNQFNIGGTTWFSSLAKLVAYHTKYSPVMENVNERLDVPVPPPCVSSFVY